MLLEKNAMRLCAKRTQFFKNMIQCFGPSLPVLPRFHSAVHTEQADPHRKHSPDLGREGAGEEVGEDG